MSAAAKQQRVAESLACPAYPSHITSLLGVLLHQQQTLAERTVCHRVRRERHGIVAEPMSIGTLLERAQRGAAKLQAAGVRQGDRVILSLSNPHDFLVAFFSTLAAGAAAVPLPTVAESGTPRSFATRVREVSQDCGPTAGIVESIQRFKAVVGELPTDMALIEVANLTDATVGAGPPLRDQPAAASAFIQYTSGSTGKPKGVVITHGNILANCSAIRDATEYSRADRMVSWLPLHHDMGLVGGLLTSIYCAAETWLMSPLAFLGRPVTWLEAITAFSATLTVGPTFAYSLCARKIPDKQLTGIDLSSLRLAYIGAEPIDPATLRAFSDRYVDYGLSRLALYPVYGLAEATLAVSFPKAGTPLRYDTVDRHRLAADHTAVPATADGPNAVTFVSVGHPLPRHHVTIVATRTGQAVSERQVGELIVGGASISPRYFSDKPDVECTELHTGDLAYFANDHLYIVDRIKDLVIIAGQNYAPSDIENAVAQVEGIRRGRVVAFSRSGSMGTEELHIVAEVTPDSWRAPSELEKDVARKVREEIGLTPATVTMVVAGSLERTSSGKIKRSACAAAHQAGTLTTLGSRSQMVGSKLARQRALLWHRTTQVVDGLRRRLGLTRTD